MRKRGIALPLIGGPARRAKPLDCGCTCIGGRSCILSGNIRHTMHMCSNPSCACHRTYHSWAHSIEEEQCDGSLHRRAR